MLETLTNLEQRRDKVVADTEEWLNRTTIMANALLFSQFPNARDVRELKYTRAVPKEVKQTVFETPFIVLPAQNVKDFSAKTDMIRRVAVKMQFHYDSPISRSKDVMEGIRSATMPVPDEISILDPHPLALPSDINSRSKLYEHDSRSISGNRLNLLRWAVFNAPGGGIPKRTAYFDEDETRIFDVFRDYPPEALRQRPEAIEHHQRVLGRFVESIADITIALQDPELNPR